MTSVIKPSILIIGAGEAGRMLLSDYKRRGLYDAVAGFVDDNPGKTGLQIEGKPVLGTTAGLNEIIISNKIDSVVIAVPSATSDEINRMVCEVMNSGGKTELHIIPDAERFFDAPLFPTLRRFQFSDIFGRDEYTIDLELMRKNFEGRIVMVTGAGGSIGSELCMQLLKLGVKKIIAVGRGENSIYELALAINDYVELSGDMPEVSYRIADVKDAPMMGRIFGECTPDIVFHAAAHKHVPLMEYNEAEAINNNAGGTLNMLRCCRDYGVSNFVLVSTDKAVHPSSVMGATKRLSEYLARYFNENHGLKSSAVRFGNVLGSRGSVIPLLNKQIEAGGPVTVTHPEVERFFMSIPEACLLVLNAASYARGGEIFVLDMGRQYKVIDLARRLIEMHGLIPEKDIKIKITGLRPGEKLSEELCYERDSLERTENRRISLIREDLTPAFSEKIEDFINYDLQNFHKLDSIALRRLLGSLVSGFSENTQNSAELTKERIVN